MTPLQYLRNLARSAWWPVLVFVLSPTAQGDVSLAERLVPLIESHQGDVGIAVRHLKTGESFQQRSNVPMPTASLIKFPVMIEAYRRAEEGELDLDALVTLSDEDKVPGSGILTYHFSDGAQFPLRDAIRLMIAYSDNTATNLVVDAIGIPSTAETMDRMGYPETKLHSKVFRRDTSAFMERSKKFGLGSTTCDDMISLLEALHARTLVNADASDAMYEHMINCQDDKLFKRHLPAGTRVAHKTGAVSDARTSAGILETPGGPIALCVLTNKNEDRTWGDSNAAERLIAQVAREVYNHFNQEPSNAEQDNAVAEVATLRLGDMSPEVEDLQRRLNAQLDPSPELSIDGDYGPMTQAALVRFQRETKLPVTGIADPRTREALGTDEVEEPSTPTPEAINSRTLPKEPAESLIGPPHVTAKAWVILDASTGALLAGSEPEKPLDMASTTKMMTAWVVLKLAQSDPAVLEEVVTFSDRADSTVGSTAAIRSGERLTVGELLYGLLLPSGNDASVALAEHFGARLGAPDDDPQELDPLQRFVSEMNREATQLELHSTHFANPHGLTAEGHQASALDLALLARTALANPTFAKIVSTRQHGSTVYNTDDMPRNLVWNNTNRLLPISGYDGVKTGTTRAAGACLVASGQRGDDHVIVVVLGSASSDARYTDSRNLFRWIWSTQESGATTSASTTATP